MGYTAVFCGRRILPTIGPLSQYPFRVQFLLFYKPWKHADEHAHLPSKMETDFIKSSLELSGYGTISHMRTFRQNLAVLWMRKQFLDGRFVEGYRYLLGEYGRLAIMISDACASRRALICVLPQMKISSESLIDSNFWTSECSLLEYQY